MVCDNNGKWENSECVSKTRFLRMSCLKKKSKWDLFAQHTGQLILNSMVRTIQKLLSHELNDDACFADSEGTKGPKFHSFSICWHDGDCLLMVGVDYNLLLLAYCWLLVDGWLLLFVCCFFVFFVEVDSFWQWYLRLGIKNWAEII